LLESRPAEVQALFHDILIKVTHFFRDAEVFEVLKKEVFPAILRRRRAADTPVRVWVPGCATGEEAYSIAIVLLELSSEQRASVPIQIFATDVSEPAIETARAGVYPENIALDVSQERLRRFFVKGAKTYTINKSVRDVCIFAHQNVTRDPPFSRLDLISCRNLLIYLEPTLQKRVMPMFHYALKADGYLLLGASETIGNFTDLFSLVDKKSKLYSKVVNPSRVSPDLSAGSRDMERLVRAAKVPEAAHGAVDMQKEADRVVMNRYAPPGVIVSADLQILQFRGQTGPYLEPAPGEASLHVLKMAREGLLLDLRAALEKAKRTEEVVRREGLRVKSNGGYRDVNIEVVPLRNPRAENGDKKERSYLVVFEEPPRARRPQARAAASRPMSKKAEARRIQQLEEELVATKGYLHAIIEEQEATNEELQSANEEILSSNEELQSINEELQTAKEELQSTNEELTTLNEELENRNETLSQVNNDLVNLLGSVNLPILMLSTDLRIRRFTPSAAQVLNLIPSDIGRPIDDIKPKIDVRDLERLVSNVIQTGTVREREVQDRDGRWYSMRVQPYVTLENKIEGAVICLVDIDALKRLGTG
ncbi:MAG TPA: CheR family methyltransferase, partial [Minicystis sp.]|nr:CheR family methyltransferase [Minicystis sp.]